MKCLLVAINAKYIHSNLAVYSLKTYGESCARDPQTRIEIAEYTINQTEDTILEDIYRRKPDWIGFSCYIWNMEYVRRLVGDLHRILPGLPIWLGGPEVSYEAEAVLRELPGVKGIMLGEGERTLDRLLAHYEGRLALTELPGLCYLDEAGQVRYQAPEAPMDLSRVPFPYPELADLSHKIIYYESSRGCPFSCSYCLSSVDKRLRFRDIELVKQELGLFLEAKVPQVKFVDRTFNCKKSHAMEIWRFLQERDNGVTNFHFEVAADLLDEEELELLSRMRPGQVQLEIGVQTTNPDTLREIRRYTKFEELKTVVERIKSFGNIHQHLDLIAGLPFEDYASFGRSFDQVYGLKPDQLQLGFLKVLKGSWMYENRKAYGLCYKEQPPYEVLFTDWLSYGDVIRLKGIEEMVEVYYNSGQFLHTLPYLERFFDSPFALFEALADYYEQHTLPGQSFSRNRRSELLLEFVEAMMPNVREGARELLMYDLYLREKVKSRPAFASDPALYKGEWSDRMNRLWEAEQTAGSTQPYRQFLHETHLEHFSMDPIALAEQGEAETGDFWYWFDYRSRDPLSGNGRAFRQSPGDCS